MRSKEPSVTHEPSVGQPCASSNVEPVPGLTTPQDHGLRHGDYHMLLTVAKDTISHLEVVESLLRVVNEPTKLPPDDRTRTQLREARNLLAVHRQQRVLYWRLTGKHTPHVKRTYQRLSLDRSACLGPSQCDSWCYTNSKHTLRSLAGLTPSPYPVHHKSYLPPLAGVWLGWPVRT